jgi:UDP-N-acetylglucosamine 1-carboxyvinyltransferase
MDKFVINGGHELKGQVLISGAKNVALKVGFASLMTDEVLQIDNVPDISDVRALFDLLKHIGISIDFNDHTVVFKPTGKINWEIPLSVGARLRTSILAIGPLLSRFGNAIIPNPGGCRIGARPIDRHIDALRKMGAKIKYNSRDGYFHATCKNLVGAEIEFEKNSHTGTESIILAAVLASGQTYIKNAAAEIEIDDLINCLNMMGADIRRISEREIVINGVKKLHGARYKIMPDRNEEITYAIAAAVTHGNITVLDSQIKYIGTFLDKYTQVGAKYKILDKNTTCYYGDQNYKAVNITTSPYPGFMTDWQGPFSVLLTQAAGVSVIHESVFENRFSYVNELQKMGTDIKFIIPKVNNPKEFYNFNWLPKKHLYQAIEITGKSDLHDAILQISDLRAGATIIIAALTAKGSSDIYGIEQVDRGYEFFDKRLINLGADIKRVKEEL